MSAQVRSTSPEMGMPYDYIDPVAKLPMAHAYARVNGGLELGFTEEHVPDPKRPFTSDAFTDAHVLNGGPSGTSSPWSEEKNSCRFNELRTAVTN